MESMLAGGGGVGVALVCPCALCVSLGVCPSANVLECAFVLVV